MRTVEQHVTASVLAAGLVVGPQPIGARAAAGHSSVLSTGAELIDLAHDV